MNTRNIVKTYLGLIALFMMSACNKYLDVLPDNRTELDNEDKITKLLVSAYPDRSYIFVTEFSTDNSDDRGVENPNSSRIMEQAFHWEPIVETSNDDLAGFWTACYSAISSANLALQSIEELGNPDNLSAQRGEALVARAFNHFLLVNLFAQHYSTTFGNTDLGVHYMRNIENTLNPHYNRNSVQEVYDFIEQDLEEGIPLIDDGIYTSPGYHFNQSAAYAFAARFYLFKENWEQAERYAQLALGNNPQSLLRDNFALGNYPGNLVDVSRYYTSSTLRTNFLLLTAITNLGTYFGPYYSGARYTHGFLIADTETALSASPWGKLGSQGYRSGVFIYGGTNIDKVLFPKLPYLFEFTDPIARIGYSRTVHSMFNSEETLLVRAEARIHLNRINEALNDLNLWKNNTLSVFTPALSLANIEAWVNSIEFYTPELPTPKKALAPQFPIASESQRNLIYALLHIRRIETLHTGLRWFDIKRYGIEIYRRLISSSNEVISISPNPLIARDPRQAFQIPQDVIDAGLTPNPR